MSLGVDVLSQITTFTKYAKYLPYLERRENWEELVERNAHMHLYKYPNLAGEIYNAYEQVIAKNVLPSMRSMQFAGPAILKNPARIFNCAYMPVNHPKAFCESMFLLLGGTGVGYSVQFHHVRELPVVEGPSRHDYRYLVGDSIEGWADAVRVLAKSYFYGGRRPRFDFQDVRPKGARLITAGGKAPGPGPLKQCLEGMERILEEAVGRKLRPIEAHDLMCVIADAVLAGGIRRAALISLFSYDDYEMANAKSSKWWETNPHRARANNSVVLLRDRCSYLDFRRVYDQMVASESGEPGFYWTSNIEYGTNPCVETALRPYQFCNLTTINASNLQSQQDLLERAYAAAIIGTVQASYTDFHYLRGHWQRQTEKDALLGVSLTGLARSDLKEFNFSEAARVVLTTNNRIAEQLGIRPSARATCIKPEGTTSLVVGSSSGIHSWHDEYYLRRMRVGKNESIYQYLNAQLPEFLEDDVTNENQACIAIPVAAPANAVTRSSESPLDVLERTKHLSKDWVKEGHRSGDNSHNVSCTINAKKDEWELIKDWAWEERHNYNGISFLPYDGGTYQQAPHETISKERYEELSQKLAKVDLRSVVEVEDETERTQEIACAGGKCEL